MNNRLLMTQSEFAAHRQVGKSAVSNWKRAGHLIFVEGPTGKLMIDVARTEARLNARVDPTRGRPSGGVAEAAAAPMPNAAVYDDGGEPLANPRIDLVREQVIEKQLKNKKAAGELVPLAEYERRSGEMSRQARERVMSVVRDQAERLGMESDPRQIISLLETSFDRMFNDMAADIEQGALDGETLAEAVVDIEEVPEEDLI